MPKSPTERIRARLTLNAKLPKLTIAWSVRPAKMFVRKTRIESFTSWIQGQKIGLDEEEEKRITFSDQGNKRHTPYVSFFGILERAAFSWGWKHKSRSGRPDPHLTGCGFFGIECAATGSWLSAYWYSVSA